MLQVGFFLLRAVDGPNPGAVRRIGYVLAFKRIFKRVEVNVRGVLRDAGFSCEVFCDGELVGRVIDLAVQDVSHGG